MVLWCFTSPGVVLLGPCWVPCVTPHLGARSACLRRGALPQQTTTNARACFHAPPTRTLHRALRARGRGAGGGAPSCTRRVCALARFYSSFRWDGTWQLAKRRTPGGATRGTTGGMERAHVRGRTYGKEGGGAVLGGVGDEAGSARVAPPNIAQAFQNHPHQRSTSRWAGGIGGGGD